MSKYPSTKGKEIIKTLGKVIMVISENQEYVLSVTQGRKLN